MMLDRKLTHDRLENRYEVHGQLLLETALHVGAGQGSAATDAAVVRDYLGRPFIPGSAVKGALRSAVERRAEWLGLWSCRLERDNKDCLTTNRIPESVVPDDSDAPRPGKPWREQPLWWRLQQMDKEEGGLCHVCKTFGSTVFGGKVQLDDLPLIKELDPLGADMVEVRDGVGIDRDSGTAVPQIKFDYEVVPSVAVFRFCLTAENLDDSGLALLALGLLEMANGAVPVGGKSTRGLGRCRLQLENLYYFDFSGGKDLAVERIISYLHQPMGDEGHREPVTFFQEHIKKYLERRERK